MFIKNPFLKWRWDGENGDFVFIVGPNNRYYLLNSTAATVFQKCDGRTSKELMIEEIAKGEDAGKVKGDIDGILEQFKKIELVYSLDELNEVAFKRDAIDGIIDKLSHSLSCISLENAGCNEVFQQLKRIINYCAIVHIRSGKQSSITKEEIDGLRIELVGAKHV